MPPPSEEEGNTGDERKDPALNSKDQLPPGSGVPDRLA